MNRRHEDGQQATHDRGGGGCVKRRKDSDVTAAHTCAGGRVCTRRDVVDILYGDSSGFSILDGTISFAKQPPSSFIILFLLGPFALVFFFLRPSNRVDLGVLLSGRGEDVQRMVYYRRGGRSRSNETQKEKKRPKKISFSFFYSSLFSLSLSRFSLSFFLSVLLLLTMFFRPLYSSWHTIFNCISWTDWYEMCGSAAMALQLSKSEGQSNDFRRYKYGGSDDQSIGQMLPMCRTADLKQPSASIYIKAGTNERLVEWINPPVLTECL